MRKSHAVLWLALALALIFGSALAPAPAHAQAEPATICITPTGLSAPRMQDGTCTVYFMTIPRLYVEPLFFTEDELQNAMRDAGFTPSIWRQYTYCYDVPRDEHRVWHTACNTEFSTDTTVVMHWWKDGGYWMMRHQLIDNPYNP